jgi:hypothetical protein
MVCQLYSCPFSDGFECFYTAEQCTSPAVWEKLYYPNPGFPKQLGFCIVDISNGYVNLSLYCRQNVTRESIMAFISIRNTSNISIPDEGLSTPLIVGIVVATVSLLFLCLGAVYLYNNIKETRLRRLAQWRHDAHIQLSLV